MTKEPKLDRARRQIPEWESYDNEIDKLRTQIANSHSAPVTIINHDQIIISAHSNTDNQKSATEEEKHIKDEL